MLQGEHSAILSTFIKLPFSIKIFVLSIFEWPLKTRFYCNLDLDITRSCCSSQFFLPWNFTKEIQENDHKIGFSYNFYSFVKLYLYYTIRL